jgi:hypothetical protein
MLLLQNPIRGGQCPNLTVEPYDDDDDDDDEKISLDMTLSYMHYI